MRVDDCAASMGILVDAVSDFLVFVGDDKELYRLTSRVDDLVNTESRDIKNDIAINDHFPVVEHKITGGDDDHIADQDDTA